MSGYEFAKQKRPDIVYLSNAFPDKTFYATDEDSQPPNLRIVSGVVDGITYDVTVPIKGDIVLRRTPKEREEIRVTIFEDDRELRNLVLQRYMVESGKPKDFSFTLTPPEIDKLLRIIVFALDGNYRELAKMKRADSSIDGSSITDIKALSKILAAKDPTLIKILVEETLTDTDVVAIAYRKKQLEVFRNLLNQDASESEWQTFFEDNPWIFGYGLNYVFLTSLDGKKLSQAIKGHALGQHGKAPDAVMKTRADISLFCLVEIKKSNTQLLAEDSYRSGVWQPTKELTGGIAQAQRYQYDFGHLFAGEFRQIDSDDNPTGELIYSFSPKTYLVVGNLDEFLTENGVNVSRLGAFELLRRNLQNPEILTFDELYHRASFIVANNEQHNTFDSRVLEDGDFPYEGIDEEDGDFSYEGDDEEDCDIPF